MINLTGIHLLCKGHFATKFFHQSFPNRDFSSVNPTPKSTTSSSSYSFFYSFSALAPFLAPALAPFLAPTFAPFLAPTFAPFLVLALSPAPIAVPAENRNRVVIKALELGGTFQTKA